MTVGELVGYLDVDDTKFNQKLDQSEKKWSTSGAGMQKAGLALSAGVTTPLLFIAGQAANSAASIEAMGLKAQTVFGDSLGQVNSWADANATAMGLTATQAAGLAANFGDLLVPMGFTRDAAAKMSTDVVGLSGALSAWTGGTRSAAEVSEILAKAMLGEREGLKELGISIMEADVQARLAQKGQEGLTGAALQQAKAMATQELIFEKSKDAQAAFSDSTETLYEKQLKTTASTAQMKETLAKALTPAVSAVTGLISRLAGWFNNLPGPTQKVIFAFGGIAAAVGPILLMLPKLAQSVKMLSGVMKLVMSGNPYMLALMAIVTVVILVIKYHDEIKNALVHAWNWIKDKVVGAAKAVWEFLKEWGPLILTAVAPVIGLPLLIIQHWDEIVAFFKNLGAKIGEFLSDLWEWISQPFIDAWNAVSGFFTETLGPGIKTFFTETLPNFIWEGLQHLYEWIVQPYVDLWTEHLQPWFSETWDKIKTFFTETLPSKIWEGLQHLYEWIVQPYVDLWTNHLQPWFAETWDKIRDFFTETLPAKIWEGLQSLYSWIVQPFVDAWGDDTTGLKHWFIETWDKIRDFFLVTLPTKISEGFTAIYDKIKAPFVAAWNWINEHIITPMKNFFSWLAGREAKYNADAAARQNDPGAYYTEPEGGTYLRQRASGGLVTRPELSLIGEAGPELVLPLSNPSRTNQLLIQHGLSGDNSDLLAELRGLRRDLREMPRTIIAQGQTGLQLGREIASVLGGV